MGDEPMNHNPTPLRSGVINTIQRHIVKIRNKVDKSEQKFYEQINEILKNISLALLDIEVSTSKIEASKAHFVVVKNISESCIVLADAVVSGHLKEDDYFEWLRQAAIESPINGLLNCVLFSLSKTSSKGPADVVAQSS